MKIVMYNAHDTFLFLFYSFSLLMNKLIFKIVIFKSRGRGQRRGGISEGEVHPLGRALGRGNGRGRNVYLEVDEEMNSLLPFWNSVHFRAGRGSHGKGKMQVGAKWEDVVVKVAPGTMVRESGGTGDVLLELVGHGQRSMLLPGGRGGRGNTSFKSRGNKVPQIAENGEEGPEI